MFGIKFKILPSITFVGFSFDLTSFGIIATVNLFQMKQNKCAKKNFNQYFFSPYNFMSIIKILIFMEVVLIVIIKMNGKQ